MQRRSRSKAQMKEWLQTHVRLDGDCRIWAGTKTSSGHPLVFWKPRGPRLAARALLLELMGKPLPERPVVWSTCGRPDCMNPAHLIAGTRPQMMAWLTEQENYESSASKRIAIARGRSQNARMGMRHARAIARAMAEGSTHAQIAAQYEVSQSAVGHALKRWREVGVI